MKKFLVVALAAITALTLAACNNSPSPSVSPSPSTDVSPSSAVPSPSTSGSGGDFVPQPSASVGLDIDPESTWGDETFEKAMRTAMGTATSVPPEATKEIKKLSLVYKDDGNMDVKVDDKETVAVEVDGPIKTLEDIARFTGIEELEIKNAELETLSHLVILTIEGSRLEKLTVTDSGVKDIEYLAMLDGLKNVDLSGNGIEDLTPLMSITTLETLNVKGNPLTDATQADQFADVDVTY